MDWEVVQTMMSQLKNRLQTYVHCIVVSDSNAPILSSFLQIQKNPLGESKRESSGEDEDEDRPLSPRQRMAKFENQWWALHAPWTAQMPRIVACMLLQSSIVRAHCLVIGRQRWTR